MNAICPIHNTQMEEKNGQFGVYFSHKTAEGYCNGKKISPFKNGGGNGSVSTPVAQDVQYVRKHDPMFVCNAMNNAVALACAERIAVDNISDYFKRILKELENPS